MIIYGVNIVAQLIFMSQSMISDHSCVLKHLMKLIGPCLIFYLNKKMLFQKAFMSGNEISVLKVVKFSFSLAVLASLFNM